MPLILQIKSVNIMTVITLYIILLASYQARYKSFLYDILGAYKSFGVVIKLKI